MNLKKAIYLKLILIFSFSIFISAQQNNFVNTKDKTIVTPDGNPILLKGINLGNWLVPEGYMFHFKNSTSPRLIDETFKQLMGPEKTNKFWQSFRENYITKKDIKLIKDLGFNSIRVPFNFRLFVLEDHPDIWLETGFKMLDKVINWCDEENIYVILDMHCAPGGQTGDNIDDSWGYPYLFESPEYQKLTIKLWQKIAERYSQKTIVLGYDLLNEPIATYFDDKTLNPKLEPLYREIVSAIRKVDTNHIIILGGAQWDSNFKIFGKPFDSKLVYTFHKYWSATTQDVIQEYIDFSNKYNVPIWLGESGENTNKWINDFRTLLEKNNIGWCFWPYKKMDSERSIVSIKRTAEFDSVITYANSTRPNFKSVRDSRPKSEIVQKAFFDYLENCQLKNCTVNQGYLEALGLKQK